MISLPFGKTMLFQKCYSNPVRTSGTQFSEIVSEIHTSPFKKMHLKMSSVKRRSFCVGGGGGGGGGDELSVTTPLPMVHSILSVSVNQPDRTLGNTFYRLALDALHNKNLFPFKFLENKIFTWKGWKGVDVSKLQRLEYKYAQGIRVPPCISHERSKYMSRALFWGPFY